MEDHVILLDAHKSCARYETPLKSDGPSFFIKFIRVLRGSAFFVTTRSTTKAETSFIFF